MPKYTVVWRVGKVYSADVLANSEEEAKALVYTLDRADYRKVSDFAEITKVREHSREDGIQYSSDKDWSNVTKEEVIDLLKTTNKPILYTMSGVGETGGQVCLSWFPSKEPISVDRALEILDKSSWIQITDSEDGVNILEIDGDADVDYWDEEDKR